jgi:pilus assembly protein Flp/PilA
MGGEMGSLTAVRSIAAAWRRLVADERGATSIEYGLMVALISLAIIGTIESLGSSINSVLFGQIVSSLASMSK